MVHSHSQRVSLDQAGHWALILGVAGLVVSIIGFFVDRQQFFRSYLLAYHYWYSLTLGSLGVLMMFHLTGGRWGVLTQRILEAAVKTIPLLALLFIPFFFGLRELYPWAVPDIVAHNIHLQHKKAYLNIPGYVTRAIIYFAVWIVLARFLTLWSLRQDEALDAAVHARLAGRLRRLSAGGLVLYTLTVTFASIDWAMSLEPEWYSTIYGAMFVTGQALESLAFIILMTWLLADREQFQELISFKALIDLGNLMLAFVILWTYMCFSQYLIIWMGNLSEEIPWILRRQRGGWQWIGVILVVFHFFVPLIVLLFRAVKRDPFRLMWVAVFLLVMRLINLYWVITPSFFARAQIHWLDGAALTGIGGVWLAVFSAVLQKAPLIARHNPRLKELVVSD